MIRRTVFVWAALLLLGAGRPSSAAMFSNAAVGTSGAAFLEIPTSARIESLGQTMAATSEGAEAIFLNPAGLAQMSAPPTMADLPGGGWRSTGSNPSEVSLGYASLLATTYAGNAAYAHSLGQDGVLAAGFLYFSQAAQTAYDSLGNSQGSFTPYDLDAALGYADTVGPVRLGGVLKIIRSQIDTASGQSEAVDLGLQAPSVGQVGNGPVDLGLAISNLGPEIKVGNAGSPLPLAVRGGFLWHASPQADFSMDVDAPNDQSPYVTLGLEWIYAQPGWSAALRAGYNQSDGRQSLGGIAGASAGAGLLLGSFRLDYAWAPFSNLGMTNRVSLAFRF